VPPFAAAPGVIQNNNNNNRSYTQNNTQVYNSNRSVSNQSVNNTYSNTTINHPPAPEQPRPQIKPLLCCRDRQPYRCPDTLSYAHACTQNPADLPRLCPIDPTQAQFCQ
jgi:hypothetical protein